MAVNTVNKLQFLSFIFAVLFSPLGKLAGMAIYFDDVFSLFLMVDFLTHVSQKLMDRSSPKFQDW